MKTTDKYCAGEPRRVLMLFVLYVHPKKSAQIFEK